MVSHLFCPCFLDAGQVHDIRYVRQNKDDEYHDAAETKDLSFYW